MGKLAKHFWTVCRHRAVVFRECRKCGLFWQGLVHDLSKFSPAEFVSSARYFQGDRSPIEAEKIEAGYSKAWLHHKGANKHHWEYWTDFDANGQVIVNKIPYKYVIEMVCDWIGAGQVYGGGSWTVSDPIQYYRKVRPGRHFHPTTEALILLLLEWIEEQGLDAFHRRARDRALRDAYNEFKPGGDPSDA